MTVSSTLSKITYQGDGATTVWTFPFSCDSPGDIDVYYTAADGSVTMLPANRYTVTLNPAIEPNPTPVGGNVLYPTAGSPAPLGTTVSIVRNMNLTQQVSLLNQGTLLQDVIEGEFDVLLMQIQQIAQLAGNVLQVPPSDPTPGLLPVWSKRANMIFGFDANGNPIAVSTVPQGVISSAMAPVCAASSIAAAQALLGISAAGYIPVGGELDYSGMVAPQYFFLELGQTVSRTGFPELFNVVAPLYGVTIASGNATVTMPARVDGLLPTTGLWNTMKVESAGVIPAGSTILSVTNTTITLSQVPTAAGNSLRIFPHGNGDGSSTFNLPDGRGYVYAGLDPQAGTGRLIGSQAAYNADARAMGWPGGQQSHQMTGAEMPVHQHAVYIVDSGHAHGIPAPTGVQTTGTTGPSGTQYVGGYTANSATGTTGIATSSDGVNPNWLTNNVGGSIFFNVTQPTIIRNKIIYAGRATF